jgi:hypothetical protein
MIPQKKEIYGIFWSDSIDGAIKQSFSFFLDIPRHYRYFYGKAANSYGVLDITINRIIDPADLSTFGLKMNFSLMLRLHLYHFTPHHSVRMSASRRQKEQRFKLKFNNYF